MKKSKILVISYWAHINEPMSILLNKYLPELSRYYDITLVSAFDDSSSILKCGVKNVEVKNYFEKFDKIFCKYFFNGFNIFWRFAVLRYFKNFLMNDEFSLVFSFSEYLSSALVANKISRIKRINHVSFFSDPLQSVVSLKFKNPLISLSYFIAERFVINNSSKIIMVNRETALVTANYFNIDINRIHTLEHAYIEPQNVSVFRSDIIILNHVGNLYHTRDPSNFLNLLADLRDKFALEIHVNFIGHVTDEIKVKISRFNSFVSFIGSVSYEESLQYFNRCTYSLIFDMNDTKGLFTASKIMESLSVNKNFIAIGKRNSALERVTLQVGGCFVSDCIYSSQDTDLYYFLTNKVVLNNIYKEYHVSRQIWRLFEFLKSE